MERRCAQCRALLTCMPEGGCWCAELPPVLSVPTSTAVGCLCRACLTKKIEAVIRDR